VEEEFSFPGHSVYSVVIPSLSEKQVAAGEQRKALIEF
jgi:hypothetical protein